MLFVEVTEDDEDERDVFVGLARLAGLYGSRKWTRYSLLDFMEWMREEKDCLQRGHVGLAGVN